MKLPLQVLRWQRTRRMFWAWALSALCGAATAQSVSLAGRMGERALLVVDGKAHMVALGSSAAGVKLLRWNGELAEVEIAGKAQSLRVGGTPALLGTAAPSASVREIVLSVGPGGHFLASGSINGKAVRFMVDTGATLVAMGADEAERLGLDLSGAREGLGQTANGPVRMQVVVLSSVRVGGVEVANVGAAILPQPMPYLLLGNSFLSRFQMQRDSDTMRLQLR